MNKVILIGRLVKDPEVKTTQSQIAFCGFTIAVDRKFKSSSGERQSDFISCVSWRAQAEFLGKYFQKGSRISVIGNLQSRSYDDANGKKVYVTEVVVDEIEFVDSKRDGQSAQSGNPYASSGNPYASSGNPYASSGNPYASSGNPCASSGNPNAPAVDNGFYPAMDDDTTLPFDL